MSTKTIPPKENLVNYVSEIVTTHNFHDCLQIAMGILVNLDHHIHQQNQKFENEKIKNNGQKPIQLDQTDPA